MDLVLNNLQRLICHKTKPYKSRGGLKNKDSEERHITEVLKKVINRSTRKKEYSKPINPKMPDGFSLSYHESYNHVFTFS